MDITVSKYFRHFERWKFCKKRDVNFYTMIIGNPHSSIKDDAHCYQLNWQSIKQW